MYGPTQSNPVGGDHGDLIAALAAFLRPSVYVELGTCNGSTFDRVAPHCGVAFGVDLNVPSERQGDPRFVQMDSVEYLKTLRAESVEFIFLDSSHEYEATLKELVEIERVLVPNGVLAMHDTYPPNEEQERQGYCGDVWRAAADLCIRRPGWQSMTLPAQYGITLARWRTKNGNQLAWKA
jgi:predicted O-methyltransferase YrrM